MKRTKSLALTTTAIMATVMVLSLAACGSKKGTGETTAQTGVGVVTTEQETVETEIDVTTGTNKQGAKGTNTVINEESKGNTTDTTNTKAETAETAETNEADADSISESEDLAVLESEDALAEIENQESETTDETGDSEAQDEAEGLEGWIEVTGTVKQITDSKVYLVTLEGDIDMEFYASSSTYITPEIDSGSNVVIKFDGVTTRSIPAQAHNVKEILTTEEYDKREAEKQEALARETSH